MMEYGTVFVNIMLNGRVIRNDSNPAVIRYMTDLYPATRWDMDYTCPICLECYLHRAESVSLNCGNSHGGCYNCMIQYRASREDGLSCPVCRERVLWIKYHKNHDLTQAEMSVIEMYCERLASAYEHKDAGEMCRLTTSYIGLLRNGRELLICV